MEVTQFCSALASLQPGLPPFRIVTMKGLYLRSVLYPRYYYNLNCEASWIVETGTSSTQDKSRIVNIILPFIMKNCTEEDMRVLTLPKPDSSSPDYDVWNTNLRNKTIEIENRLAKLLESDEDTYFPLRDKTKLRRKQMSVNGVEGRLAELKKLKRNQKSSNIGNFCSSMGVTSKTSSSMQSFSTPSEDTLNITRPNTILNNPHAPVSCGTSSSSMFHQSKNKSLINSSADIPNSNALMSTKIPTSNNTSDNRNKKKVDLKRQKNVMDSYIKK